jgi:hypothetical protein
VYDNGKVSEMKTRFLTLTLCLMYYSIDKKCRNLSSQCET